MGVERPQWQNNYGEICKNSYLKKHGHPHKLTNETKRLIKKTKLERYGTYMPQLKYKSYRFPSGKTIKIPATEFDGAIAGGMAPQDFLNENMMKVR